MKKRKSIQMYVCDLPNVVEDLGENYRTFFIDEDDKVYICGDIMESKSMIIIKISCDGTDYINHEGNIYVPIEWLKKEYKDEDIFEIVEKSIAEKLNMAKGK